MSEREPPQGKGREANTPVKVKICGITTAEDALYAVERGAWALGFIFYPPSPRYVTVERCAEICAEVGDRVHKVGVFVDAPYDEIVETGTKAGLTVAQLHGKEGRKLAEKLAPYFADVWKAVRVGEALPRELIEEFDGFTLLLDTYVRGQPGGTGRTFSWELVKEYAAQHPVVLAGGLGPENIHDAVAAVRPYAVDVSSGVEASAGRKDHLLVRKLFERL